MRRTLRRKLGHGLLVLAAIWIAAAMTGTGVRIAAAEEGPAVKQFHLYATDGYLTLPDGAQVYIWGYSLTPQQGTASYPSPALEVNEGDVVEVTLTNIGAKKDGIKRAAHTIHWHGLDTDQRNDGVPHTSPAVQVGESFTYRFTANHAGTYFYHCHVDTVEHLQMGMFGAFIVGAKGGAKQAWTGGPAFDKEYVFVANEIDPVWHQAVENGKPYDRTAFHPTYWTLNGKAYPDTEQDPSTMIEGTVGQTVLIRMVNSGYQSHSFHMHGYHFQVIASDGRPLPQPLTKDTILIGPGERYDLLVTFDQSGMFPFHSHNVVDNTNNGVYPGGLHTMVEVKEQASATTVKKMTMKAGNKPAWVDGRSITLPNPPVAMGGTAYVPLRFIGEQLGADLKWVQSEQSVIYTWDMTVIQLWVNKTQAQINGILLSIPAPPVQLNGAVMVPVQFITEHMGAEAVYDRKTGDIVITGTAAAANQPPHTHDSGSTNTGGSKPEPAAGTDADNGQPIVTITKSAFVPGKLTIKKGQTVKWINQDTQIHTVYDLGDAFASKNLLKNDEFVFTFQTAGTYTYYCSTHPTMQAEITVTD